MDFLNAGTIDVSISGTSPDQKTTILAKNLEVHNSRAESPNAGYSTKVTVTDYVKLDVADVNVGYANSNLSGQAILNIGDNVDMTLNSLNVRNSTMADSGSYALFEIGSNSTLTAGGGLGFGTVNAASGEAIIRFTGENSSLSTSNFQTNSGVKTGGSVLFEMLGKNNSYYTAGDFNINGYTTAAVSGGSAGVVVAGEGYSKSSKSELILQGSGNTINLTYLRLYANSSFTLDNNAGGWISFVSDSQGFSTINTVNSDISSGFISIDLSNLSGVYEDEKFTLISCENSIGLRESNIKITLRDGDEDGAAYVSIDVSDEGSGYELNLYYTSSVPEPAACAAVFGALVLALSAFRRGRGAR